MTYTFFTLLFGIWNIFFSFIAQTKNFQSALVFKAIPFIGGATLTLMTLKEYGWL